jgi:hypothetical protein
MTLSTQLANYTHLLVHELSSYTAGSLLRLSMPGDLCCFFGQFDVLLVYAGPNIAAKIIGDLCQRISDSDQDVLYPLNLCVVLAYGR